MPCSQCGQVGHNITRCYNFMAAIDPDVLSTEYIPPLMRPMRINPPIVKHPVLTKPKETRESIRIQQDKEYKEAEERDRLRNEAIATLSGPVNHKEVMNARLLFFERKFG